MTQKTVSGSRKKEEKMILCFSYKWLENKKKFAVQRKFGYCKKEEVRKMDIDWTTTTWESCNKPTADATNLTYINPSGCGPCLGDTRGSGCEECYHEKCNARLPVKCYQGDSGEDKDKILPSSCAEDSVSVCSAPMLHNPDNGVDVPYACGPCPEGTKDKECRECVGRTKYACNSPKKFSKKYGCLSYEFDSVTGVSKRIKGRGRTTTITCETGYESPEICNRPSFTALPLRGDVPVIPTNTTYTNSDTCGPCNSDSIACQECQQTFCNWIPIKCYQTKFGLSTPTECQKTQSAATKCRKPIFENYIGFSKRYYGCGDCGKRNDNKKTCEQCTGEVDKACNEPPALGPEFLCYNFWWDSRFTRDRFATEVVSCPRLLGVEAICNGPTEGSTGANYTAKTGCGPCPSDLLNEGSCFNCTGELCNVIPWNGAKFIGQGIANLILLLAVLHLFG